MDVGRRRRVDTFHGKSPVKLVNIWRTYWEMRSIATRNGRLVEEE